ncbi:unannotated protein [freshwater metagenome]|uniref:Unannotated protein n=1 Tax=freshwater metagenome TaxID=449393 RepID=A0A6J6HBH0_9ZZZZ|nr:hypothetical protein [Actinomycetota bacterium]
MTIRKGSSYGIRRSGDSDIPEASTDAELARIISSATDHGVHQPLIRVTGGDMFRTLGGHPSLGDGTSDDLALPIDVAYATLDDGEEHLFVSHLVARRRWWSGRFVAVMNAEWLGDLDLGVRSHPGDGLLDITDGRLAVRERITARRRARTGSHVPHPALRTSRAAFFHTTFDPPLAIHLDGVRHGKVSSLSIRLETDFALVVL